MRLLISNGATLLIRRRRDKPSGASHTHLVAHLVGTIEFNFRDAKQYWGLEDFMTTNPTRVTNAANLSLFMVNLVERLLRDERREQEEISVLDLKARCRGAKYVEET